MKTECETESKIECEKESNPDSDSDCDSDRSDYDYRSLNTERNKRLFGFKYINPYCLYNDPDWINSKKWIDEPHNCLHYIDAKMKDEKEKDMEKDRDEYEELYNLEFRKNRRLLRIIKNIKDMLKPLKEELIKHELTTYDEYNTDSDND